MVTTRSRSKPEGPKCGPRCLRYVVRRHFNTDVVNARTLAPAMLTEERVRGFGNARIQEIFDNMPLEDFQQEYESAWLDEQTSWITWDEIKRNQIDAQAGQLLYRQVRCSGKAIDTALSIIDEVAGLVRDHKIEGVLAGGNEDGSVDYEEGESLPIADGCGIGGIK